jgi:two-component system sensor histidine kinase SenX3
MRRRDAGAIARIDRARFRIDEVAADSSTSLDQAVGRLDDALDRQRVADAASGAVGDRLLAALEVIPQGIVLADGDAHVVYRNQVAAAFADARHSDALVQPAIEELVVRAVNGRSETRTIDLYGPPRRTIQLRAVPLGATAEVAGSEDGQAPTGAFLVVEDVSERQRVDAMRRDFVANISHELKTPVGAIGLLADTLVEEDDLAVVHRLAERMQREAFRVADTIDDLLQLSLIEAGEATVREPVDVAELIREAVERTRPAAELADVRLSVEANADGPISGAATAGGPVVLGDRRQLTSALANLCDNAVKYSDPGGEVIVRVRADGATVAVEVADQGVGIPASDLDRVFERFYRVDRARSRNTGGTGLGLAIVRHVAQNHAGEVHVVSREGEGSTFTLTIPAGS